MKTILCLHSSADLYGSDRSLLRLVTGGLPFRFLVVVPYEGPLCVELRRAGVVVEVLPLAVIRRKLFHFAGLLRLAWELVRQTWLLLRLIRREKVDALLANTTAVLGGELAALLAGKVYLQYVREIIEKPRLVARFMSWRGLLADRVICVSEGTRRNYVAQCPAVAGRTVVLHNGIVVGRFEGGNGAKVREELGIGKDTVVVGSLGRISPFKGMDFLVDAAAAFFKARPSANVRFVIVGSAFREKAGQGAGDKSQGSDGDGVGKVRKWESAKVRRCANTVENSAFSDLMPAERELLGRIKELGLEGKCLWRPFREDVADVLAALDVFVLPSMLPDPFPTVVLEAMAAGRPVIGTAHGGVPEMVVDGGRVGKCEGGKVPRWGSGQEKNSRGGDLRTFAPSDFQTAPTGLLVKPGDVGGLAEAVAALVEDGELRRRMGDAGRARVRECFSVERYIREIGRILESCLDAAGKEQD